MLEEMDAEFGVGELVSDEFQTSKKHSYSSKDLRGLRVEHDVDNFTEGRNVVMTLKDKGVLEEEDDVLVNVNLVDDEKYKKVTLFQVYCKVQLFATYFFTPTIDHLG